MLQLESTHSFLSACKIEWKSWIKLADITLMIYSKTLDASDGVKRKCGERRKSIPFLIIKGHLESRGAERTHGTAHPNKYKNKSPHF